MDLTVIFTKVTEISWILGVLILVTISGFYLYCLPKLKSIEENIFILKDCLDNLEYFLFHPGLSQPILDKRVEKEGKPIKDEIERLKMERQFLLDKIPIIGWFRK